MVSSPRLSVAYGAIASKSGVRRRLTVKASQGRFLPWRNYLKLAATFLKSDRVTTMCQLNPMSTLDQDLNSRSTEL
jgi:hypothetical protein